MGEPVATRLPEETLNQLDEFAKRQGISRSKALKQLTEGSLQTSVQEADLKAISDIKRLESLFDEAQQLSSHIQQKTQAQKQKVREMMADHFDLSDVDTDQLKAFSEQPYKMLAKGKNEYYVVVPRFVPFSVGHLMEQDDAWNVFVINKYVAWIEDIPTSISEKIDIGKRFDEVTVEDGELRFTSEEEREEAWDEIGREGGLGQRRGEQKITIKPGSEFDVIASLIEKGNLPFAPKPLEEDLLGEPENVSLRPYQERAWEKFQEYGQVGVYWPPGLGKTFFALYAGERIDGKKLVVVPSSTLEEQWKERIRDYTDRSHRWEVKTYQYLTRSDRASNYNPKLTVFDECHTLPANTFSKLATIETDYRIGLSATPYREDERTDYIFALTGVPIGIQWEELLQYGDFDYPEVTVYLYRTERLKREDLQEVVRQSAGKTLVFCDRIEEGQRISEMLDVPFVHGETRKSKRLDIIRENPITVVSRVGDEGLSMEDLDRVIEYKFHGSSRRQELQRAGRTMHSSGIGTHIVQMTDEEFEKFGSRLYSLEEKGMDIRIERRE